MLKRMGSFNKNIIKEKKVGRTNVTTTLVIPSSKDLGEMTTSASNVAVELAEALKKVNNCYAQVSFGASEGMGHATAVWIAQDACFYDPNAGEFYFSNKKDFFKWFEVFYRHSYQGWPCNFNGRYGVSQFALSNTASKGAYAKAVLSVAGAR